MSLDELRAAAEAARSDGWYERELPSPDVVLALVEVAEAAREYHDAPYHRAMTKGACPICAALDRLERP